LVDATVFPENIKFPNDVGLLNDVREWLIKQIKEIVKETGEKVRTYCRKARKVYLNFAKNKRKSKKAIKKAKKQMLQFVGRNIKQAEKMILTLDEELREELRKKIELAKEILNQQTEMYREKTNRIKGRIVSFNREYVRPIKTRKKRQACGVWTERGVKLCGRVFIFKQVQP